MKRKGINEAQFLALLEKILSKVAPPTVATAIYEEVSKQVRLLNSISAFEKFCEKGSVPNVEPETVAELKSQLESNFGEDNVTITPAEDNLSLSVEITLPDNVITSSIKVEAPDENSDEQEAPFVPFPVSLPEDEELVWLLARRENLGPDEASRALANIEEEFWATKKGQILLRQHVERSFAEFIANVPASALKESGIKRIYKEPETLKTLNNGAAMEAL